MVLYHWIFFIAERNGIFFMQKDRINRSICFWSHCKKSIQNKDDRECHLLCFAQEMGIVGVKKTGFHDEIAELRDSRLRPPPA
jgi:hypothetical protein